MRAPSALFQRGQTLTYTTRLRQTTREHPSGASRCAPSLRWVGRPHAGQHAPHSCTHGRCRTLLSPTDRAAHIGRACTRTGACAKGIVAHRSSEAALAAQDSAAPYANSVGATSHRHVHPEEADAPRRPPRPLPTSHAPYHVATPVHPNQAHPSRAGIVAGIGPGRSLHGPDLNPAAEKLPGFITGLEKRLSDNAVAAARAGVVGGGRCGPPAKGGRAAYGGRVNAAARGNCKGGRALCAPPLPCLVLVHAANH